MIHLLEKSVLGRFFLLMIINKNLGLNYHF